MYYGVDLHKGSIMVASMENDGSGKRTRRISLENNGLSVFLEMLGKDDYVAVESTSGAFRFFDEVSKLVKRCFVINTWEFDAITKSTMKTDKRDAKKLVAYLHYMVTTNQEDLIPYIYVPTQVVRELRCLFSSYQLAVKELVMTKNRIRALFHEQGLTVILPEGGLSAPAVKEIAGSQQFPLFIHAQIEAFANIMEVLEKSIENIADTILRVGSVFKKEIEILTSIRGISVFIALAIMADVGDISRFKSAKNFCSYLRTAPKIDASDKSVKVGKINRRSRTLSLSLLLQPFNHFLEGSEKIHDFYYRKKAAKGSGKARIAVSRRMFTIIYAMLKNQEYYRFRDEKNHAQKLAKYHRFLKKIA
jgi:transposase